MKPITLIVGALFITMVAYSGVVEGVSRSELSDFRVERDFREHKILNETINKLFSSIGGFSNEPNWIYQDEMFRRPVNLTLEEGNSSYNIIFEKVWGFQMYENRSGKQFTIKYQKYHQGDLAINLTIGGFNFTGGFVTWITIFLDDHGFHIFWELEESVEDVPRDIFKCYLLTNRNGTIRVNQTIFHSSQRGGPGFWYYMRDYEVICCTALIVISTILIAIMMRHRRK